jgi:hypothetical protein
MDENARRAHPPIVPEPAWVRWWRIHPTGKPNPDDKTKAERKRARRARRGK